MAAAAVISNQSVVDRVGSLPLLSSTCGLLTSVYVSTRASHPYVTSVCEAAELGVRSITSPLLDKLEPQIAIANNLACKGLDTIERTLPILYRPPEQMVSSARGAVTTATHAVAGTLSGSLSSGVERTRAVVSGVLESRVGRLVSGGVDSALSTSESLVERYLPLTEEELELEAKTVRGFEEKQTSYYVRLGSLSSKLRRRSYSRALAKLQEGKKRSREFISELNSTIDLIEYGRKNIDGANQIMSDKLSSLVAWKSNSPNQESGHEAEIIESHTLALARSLAQKLQTSCLVVVSGLQGLPNHVQQEALSLTHAASQLYCSLSRASVLGELPDGLLSSSRVHLGNMKDSLDSILDYLVNNTPLNWLVGPFYPRMAPEPTQVHTPAPASSRPPTHGEGPADVEMESLQH